MLDAWKKGDVLIKVGPQNGKRRNAEGPLGRTTLKEFTHKLVDRDFVASLNQWEEEKKAAAIKK